MPERVFEKYEIPPGPLQKGGNTVRSLPFEGGFRGI